MATKALLIIGLTVGIVAAVFGGLLFFFKGHAITQQALGAARASSEVTRVTGAPLEPGWLVFGRIKNGAASLTIGVQGPAGSGSLKALGDTRDGDWTLRRLTFTPTGSDAESEVSLP